MHAFPVFLRSATAALFVVVGLFTATAPSLRAATITATLSSATSVPITADGYTATGNQLALTLTYAPTTGTQFTVIKNTGRNFIDGTFSNIANGATVNLVYNGVTYSFVAWYYGGTGNDLVLLRTQSGIAGWGLNSSGQLGDTTNNTRSAPAAVDQSGALAGKVIAQISRGSEHVLALTTEGKVYAWGNNVYGQLGDGSTIGRATPAAVNTDVGTSALAGKTVVAVTASDRHSLALCSDGTVVGWGDNTADKIRINYVPQLYNPTVVAVAGNALAGKSVVAIAACYDLSMALCSDGSIIAWGGYSSTGLGGSVPSTVDTISSGSALTGKSVISIACGAAHMMALCSDGTVAAWGANGAGQLGDGTVESRMLPTAVNTTQSNSALYGKTVTAIAAGGGHSLALCSDGTIVGWGADTFGQLGRNSSGFWKPFPGAVNMSTSSSALLGKTVVAIAAGEDHSLALCSDGTLAGFGRNTDWQIGGGSTTAAIINPTAVNRTSGSSVLVGRNVSALSTGFGNYSLCVYAPPLYPKIKFETLTPTVKTLSSVSLLDFGTAIPGASIVTFRVSNSTADSIPLQRLAVSFSGVDAGSFTVLDPLPAIIANGGTFTFRVALTGPSAGLKNASIQLTANNQNTTASALLTGTVQTSIKATLTGASTGALSLAAPDLSASKLNLTLGFAPAPGTQLTVIKNTARTFFPGQFSNLPNGSAVYLNYGGVTYPFVAWYYGGDGNDLVLLWPATGLAAWGNNSSGQLGDNTAVSRSTPVAMDQTGILAGKVIVQMAHGLNTTVALTSEGRVYQWINYGNSSVSVVRSKAFEISKTGTSALAGKFVIAISTGQYHVIALCSDGSVAVWGENTYGQFGNGNWGTPSSQIPVAVSTSGPSALTGKSVVAIAAGGEFSLALCSDGSLAGWGMNASHQLGDASEAFSGPIPVQVNALSGSSFLFGKTVTAIAAGDTQSMALCSDGTIAAWGTNTGAGTNDYFNYSPVKVSNTTGSALLGKTVTAVAGGKDFSVALCSDGSLVTWGQYDFVPVAVSAASGTALSGKTVVAITSGLSHTIALCSDGTAVSWGANSSGQLGNGTVTDSTTAVAVDTTPGNSALAGRTITSLSIGKGDHAVAIYATPLPMIGLAVLEPSLTALAPDTSSVDFGGAFSGASARTFRITNNASNSLPLQGIEFTFLGANAAAFKVVGRLPESIAPGTSADVRVAMVGPQAGAQNAFLRITSNGPAATPFVVALTGSIQANVAVSLSSDSGNALVLAGPDLSTSTLQLSLGFAPTPGTQLTVIKNSKLGFFSSEFSNLRNGATIHLNYGGVTYPFVAWYYGGDGNDLVLIPPTAGIAAWGNNSTGEIGDGSQTRRVLPTATNQSGALSGKTVVQLARGGSHTLAVTTEGKVYAWGYGSYGQLGDGTTPANRVLPVAVDTTDGLSALAGKFVVAISAGAYHSLALCSDGTVAIWGYNNSNRLGTTSTTWDNITRPRAVDTSTALAGKSVVAISAGGSHSLALCSDGTVAAWGNNDSYQKGDGGTTVQTSPVAVDTTAGHSALADKEVTAISAGYEHSVALCSDGTLATWGANSFGQLGLGSTVTTNKSPVAVDITGASSAFFGKSVVSISAGGNHTLALCSDGSVIAWGANNAGQLGDGTNANNRLSAVPVNRAQATSALFGRTVTGIYGGYQNSSVRFADGSISSWGRGTAGEIGDGALLDRVYPTLVSTSGATNALAGRFVSTLATGSSGFHSVALYGAPAPSVSTLAATDVTGATATLNASINPQGVVTSPYFEYGLTSAYGTVVPLTLSPSNGVVSQSLSATISALAPGSTYHFRVVAQVDTGTVRGEDQVVNTTPTSPLALWKLTQFAAQADNVAISGNDADPDGDGVSNLIEYATRTPAHAANTGPLQTVGTVVVQPGNIPAHQLTFPYRADATEIRYVIQRSADISAWETIYTFAPNSGQTTESTGVNSWLNAENETISVSDSTNGTKIFWRLQIELLP